MKSFNKSILYVFSFFLIVIIGCEKDKFSPIRANQSGLTISEDTLFFNDVENNKSFTISSKSATKVAFEIVSFPDWLTINPRTGLASQNAFTINVRTNSNFSYGNNSGTISINTDLGVKYIKVFKLNNNTILVNGSSLNIPDSIVISPFENSKNLTITNSGTNLIDYKFTISNYHIYSDEKSGVLLGNSIKNISLIVNRDTMTKPVYYSEIALTLENTVKKIKVIIENKIEKKQILNYDILDAEYAKPKNILVYVAANTNKLFIYDTQTELTKSIDLAFVPTCVSVSLDGTKAVVGHDGHVSYVNLDSKTLLNSFDVSCNALDIVLGTNEWAYVFPKTDQWEYIRCIKLDNPSNAEVMHKGYSIYAGTLARLHPSGKYIYGANNGLSPSDIERYDIQKDTAYYIRDSPYHGDHAMNGNIWFSEDGNRIFTRGASVLKSTSDEATDMLYNGKITIEDTNPYGNHIKSLDHSSAKGNIYLIAYGDYNKPIKPYLYIFNSSNLVFKNKIELEKYYISDGFGGGKTCDSEPYFVFSNSTGNTVFVLAKAVNSGLEKDWSLQKISID